MTARFARRSMLFETLAFKEALDDNSNGAINSYLCESIKGAIVTNDPSGDAGVGLIVEVVVVAK